MKRSVPVILGAALALTACGGGSASAPPPETPAAPAEGGAAPTTEAPKEAAGPMKAPGEAQPGDTTTCPISGEEFVVEASSPSVEHEGKTYYFCCSGCKKKFESDPAKYLTKG
jgi:YHS domain-containing protein